MQLKLKQFGLAAALIALALPALAKDVALLIGNRDYDNQAEVRYGKRVKGTAKTLEQAGFEVFMGLNLNNIKQFALASKFYEAMDGADRVVIFFGGHVVSNAQDTWFLATNADQVNMFSVGRTSLPLAALLEAAGRKRGGAVVLFGTEARTKIGFGLSPSLSQINIPEGVTLLKGPTADLAQVLVRQILKPEVSLYDALRKTPRGVSVDGHLPRNRPFLSANVGGAKYPNPRLMSEEDYLDELTKIGTPEAYEQYLDYYPYGNYARAVKRRIQDLRFSPENRAKAQEDQLELSRNMRREIQRNLSILGFNPRGIDGLFGPGSRAAILAWQKTQKINGFGYLSDNQIAALQRQARERSRELEIEAERRQAEEDRKDVSYWRQIGQGDSEDGLRAYLQRFPDGLYSERARARLDKIEESYRANAAADERRYWDQVQNNGRVRDYRQYIREYPQGAFSNMAENRIRELEDHEDDRENIEKAKAEEGRVARNGIVRALVERKLKSLGLEPGRVDGKFDDHTRRAVRRFQRARELPVTGYVTQKTMVQLLSSQ